MTARSVSLLALLLCASPVPASYAESPIEEASRLFEEGSRLLEEKRPEQALERFEAAIRLVRSYKIDYNIALALFALGRFPEAGDHYEAFLREGATEAPVGMVSSARARLEKIRARVGRVRVVNLEPGQRVSIDGRPVGRYFAEAGAHLSPGSHTLVYAREGAPAAEIGFEVGAGEARELELVLPPRAVPARPATSLVPVGTTDEAASRRRTRTVAGYSLLGTGAALTAVGAVLLGVAAWNANDIQTRDSALSYQESQEQSPKNNEELMNANRMAWAGGVVGGVGVAAAAVGIWVLLTRPPARDASSSSSKRPRAKISLDRSTPLVGLEGSF
jgi:tetratricopeptide (TPR) repeat protein